MVVLDAFMLYLLVGNIQERIMSCSFLELFEQLPSLSVVSLEVRSMQLLGWVTLKVYVNTSNEATPPRCSQNLQKSL